MTPSFRCREIIDCKFIHKVEQQKIVEKMEQVDFQLHFHFWYILSEKVAVKYRFFLKKKHGIILLIIYLFIFNPAFQHWNFQHYKYNSVQ